MKILKRLKDITPEKELFIYGCGAGGENLFKIIRKFLPEIKIEAFFDTFKSGEFCNKRVIKFDTYEGHQNENSLVLIASMNWRAIEAGLKSAGVENYLVVPPRFLVDSGLKRLCESDNPLDDYLAEPLFNEVDKKRYSEDLKRTVLLLGSSEEKQLFELLWGKNINSLDEHVEALSDHYYKTSYKGQYYDFIDNGRISSVIEGGVFTGDETVKFLRNFPEAKLWGFEPFYKSYEEGPFADEIKKSGRAEIIPKGLWSSKTTLKLKGEGLSANLSDFGEGIDIEVDSIDSFVKRRGIDNIDFIKLDVEGAEYEVLKGAEETLVKHRPQLAVCLYHQKEDYYQIPLYLAEILNSYNWHIAHYRASFFETVWYGIPDDLS